jgi:hypothetical protein
VRLFRILFGPPDVVKLKTKSNIGGLIKALSYEKDMNVRVAAATALGEIGDEKAVDPLIASLRDPSDQMRSTAAVALTAIGTPAVKRLITLLRSAQPLPVRLASYSALEHIQGGLVPETDDQKLVEDVAEQIRFLYSRTKKVTEWQDAFPTMPTRDIVAQHYYPRNEESIKVEREVFAPDINGIHNLITSIPQSLRERIRARSGQVKYEDDLWL